MGSPSFKIRRQQPITGNVMELMYHQMDYIIHLIQPVEEIDHEAVHEVRKSCKRVRAVLRLIRDDIGYSAYYRENRRFRDMSRLLSETRDYEALCHSLDYLRSREVDDKISRVYSELSAALVHSRDVALNALKKDKKVFQQIEKEIGEARKKINLFSFPSENFEVILPGLVRTHKKWKQHFAVCLGEAHEEMIHNLRKKSKYLMYHMQILKPVFPEIIRGYAGTLKKVSVDLGDHRDLFLLRQQVSGLTKNSYPKTLTDHIDASIEKEMHDKLETALRAGRYLYLEKSRPLMDRIHNYWKIYTDSDIPNQQNSGLT